VTKIISELPVVDIDKGMAGRIRPGSGDQVLWLHGYTVDSSLWGDMWERLPGWHHVGIDLPGHGASGPMTDAGDLPTLGRRLGQFCVDRGIRHIVAISFGTMTAIQIAIEFPTYFSTVVLSAPSLAGGPQEPDVQQTYMRLFQLYYTVGTGPQMRDAWMACRVWNGLDKVPGLKEELATLVDRHSWDEMRSFAMKTFVQPAQTQNDIQRVQAAVQIIIGDREMETVRANAEMLTNALPRSERHELTDTDHLCMMQSPDVSARLIDAHLRKHAVHAPDRSGASAALEL
jgi:pimeloyl-ACP methyl ester carboxylesterase